MLHVINECCEFPDQVVNSLVSSFHGADGSDNEGAVRNTQLFSTFDYLLNAVRRLKHIRIHKVWYRNPVATASGCRMPDAGCLLTSDFPGRRSLDKGG